VIQGKTSGYSSGESDANPAFHVPLSRLPEVDKRQRILWLWSLAYKKARGASVIIQKHVDQNNKIYLDGFAHRENVNYLKNQQE